MENLGIAFLNRDSYLLPYIFWQSLLLTVQYYYLPRALHESFTPNNLTTTATLIYLAKNAAGYRVNW